MRTESKYIFVIGLIIGLIDSSSEAAQVSATPEIQLDYSGTATGSSVKVLSDGSSTAGYRTDCFLQNNGTHVMYYSFLHVATSADKQLAAGNIMNCADGVTISSQALNLLGTNNDAYALTESFVRGQ